MVIISLHLLWFFIGFSFVTFVYFNFSSFVIFLHLSPLSFCQLLATIFLLCPFCRPFSFVNFLSLSNIYQLFGWCSINWGLRLRSISSYYACVCMIVNNLCIGHTSLYTHRQTQLNHDMFLNISLFKFKLEFEFSQNL